MCFSTKIGSTKKASFPGLLSGDVVMRLREKVINKMTSLQSCPPLRSRRGFSARTMSVFFRSFDNRQSVVTSLLYITILVFSLAAAPELLQSDVSRPVWFGTTLDPQTVMTASQQLAKSLANPTSSQWQAKGDQKRTYFFAQANAQIAYRVCVPSTWDGKSKLPLVIFLHGAGNTESSYLEQNNNQMIKLADQHGYLLISPLGCQ
jgi:hypothetical protein